MTTSDPRYDDLAALYINCTLKPSPQLSHTQGLIDVSAGIMRKQGVRVETVRAVDHDIATGVWPDMTEHGAATDAWPQLYEKVLAADILVLAGPIWLGDNSSVTKRVIERLYACSHLLNDAGQYAYYGRVGGCLITGNEDGVKHSAMNILYSLQHLGYTISPQADAGWIGEAGPGPSYLDPGSGGPENDFTNRNTTFMTWNLMHLARMLKDAGGIPAHGNQRSEWDAGMPVRLRESRLPLTGRCPRHRCQTETARTRHSSEPADAASFRAAAMARVMSRMAGCCCGTQHTEHMVIGVSDDSATLCRDIVGSLRAQSRANSSPGTLRPGATRLLKIFNS
jgi:multimeric flavodoxin WrbA